MRIQVLSTHALFDNRINRHLNTLVNRGYRVCYINASKATLHASNSYSSNVELIHINEPFIMKNIKGIMRAYQIMAKEINNSDACIVHIHDPVLIPLLFLAKKKGKKTVYDRHESYEKTKGISSTIATLFERLFTKYIDGIVYVNMAQLGYIEKLRGIRTKMIPNYQSLSSYTRYLNPKKIGDSVTVIYVGSLSERTRNIILMLDVMDVILSEVPAVKFILGGDIKDITVKDKVSTMKQHANFQYKGIMKYENVIDETLKADIGLYFAKDRENNFMSSPNKVYEYMLAGVALVGMGTFMHAEEINGSAGRVFDYTATKEEIASYIVTLIRNKQMLLKLKENAKAIGQKYTWESVEELYFDLYDELINIHA